MRVDSKTSIISTKMTERGKQRKEDDNLNNFLVHKLFNQWKFYDTVSACFGSFSLLLAIAY